jgi:hypothetical protein
MNLSTRAMLVTLNISQWTAKKISKKGTEEICQKHGTTAQWAKASKTLVADEELKKIASIANEARTYHYSMTLPWSDAGQRILPAKAFLDYTQAMRKFSDEFFDQVDKFTFIYPDLKEEARKMLNGLFEEKDYPDSLNIRKKYKFETIIDPLPESTDFRVSLTDADTARIKAEIEERTNERVREAMADLWTRLFEVVTHIREKLSQPDAIFRDTLIDNARDLCKILPKLNIGNDQKLEALSERVKTEIALISPDALRHNKELRKDTAQKADEIFNLMTSYMGEN